MKEIREEAITGCIIGTAIGDSMGLPFEGLSRARQNKLFRDRATYHFLFNRGMVSDDTEHACMVCQALIASAGSPEAFSRELASRLKQWLFCLPAGTGCATLRAILKLFSGFPPEKSGVFSAGNGPAMRSPLIGVVFEPHTAEFRDTIRLSTIITHRDPKAEAGALAVALAAHMSASSEHRISPGEYCAALNDVPGEKDAGLMSLVEKMAESIEKGADTPSFASGICPGGRVSGYMYHTVPVVLHCWLLHQNDYHLAIQEIIGCGGDTDTTAAIVGAIIGARVGKSGIPAQWIENLWEWPRSAAWMEKLGRQLHEAMTGHGVQKPLSLPIPGVVARNLLFMLIVLLHGFRRLLPPY